jgi:hypothetical protein
MGYGIVYNGIMVIFSKNLFVARSQDSSFLLKGFIWIENFSTDIYLLDF